MTTPTLSDVAQAAGVSYATADRVINKRGNVAAKSIAKVQDAVEALGYVRNIAAANLSRGRVYRLAFLIPKGRNAFFERIRQHIDQAARHLQPDRVSIDIIEVAAFAVEELQASLADFAAQDIDGIAIVGLQAPGLAASLSPLQAKGTAVVSLVSDLPAGLRAAYIGIDNRMAGRTAARMIGMAHAGGAGAVMAFAGALQAHDHAERLAGFAEVMQADFRQIRVLDPVITMDEAATLKTQAQTAIQENAGITALYNAGAGNSGLIDALQSSPTKRPFCVVHELVAHTRKALQDRYIDLVIDQRPDIEINRAITVLRALIDEKDPPPMPDLVPSIYVADNLPTDTLTDQWKAEDT